MFPYGNEVSAELRRALSESRFAAYLRATNGDDEAAFRLYAWNCAASAAFYGPLQSFEVTLRNVTHDTLGRHLGNGWIENDQLLRLKELEKVREARRSIEERGRTPTTNDLIAEVSFALIASRGVV